jgi:integrase
MSVRKRTWTTRKGERKESWIVDYVDQAGDRHIQTFARKKDAEEYHATVKVDVRQGVHTPHSASKTVAQGADDWLDYVRGEGAERSTLEHYRNHIRNHIAPLIGTHKLSKLTAPGIETFRDALLAKLSRAQAKKVLVSLKSLLRDAVRRGTVAQNVALAVKIGKSGRHKKKLKVGEDIPTPDEIKAIIHAADGRIRPMLLCAIFTGMRSSELRGLRWADIDLNAHELHVTRRADRYNQIGPPKSKAGARTIPMGEFLTNTLRQWKHVCPKGDLGLAFPNTVGKIWDHADVVVRFLAPTMVKAGVVDSKGEAKYTGLHALRHFFASWCINAKEAGGLGLTIKEVQERMGHATAAMTTDTYGHLFKRDEKDEARKLNEAERRLLAVG